ncbi:MAG: ATPase, T2SS/T4P/T4SS family [Candidatus Thorarchaeota archaeon]
MDNEIIQLQNGWPIEEEQSTPQHPNHPMKTYEYNVGPYHVTVCSGELQSQGQYQVRFREDIINLRQFKDWANKVKENILSESEIKILTLDQSIEKMKPFIQQLIQTKGISSHFSSDTIIPAMALEVLGLGRLAPLLLDTYLEEIYLDGDSEIYLDHSVIGRCSTSLRLSPRELDIFLNRVTLDNDSLLTQTNPSMKADLTTEWFHLRISADIPPLTLDGPKIIIRKLREKGLTLPDLCANMTLIPEAATFLLFALLNGVDITIVGAPASGKTTLQNALLAFLPPFFRVVSIEDVEETFAGSFQDNGHLIRFKVDPIERGFIRRTKSEEVIKLLHRSPDLICFSEISTSEHAKAWFEAMCAGIQSVQTIHGRTIAAVVMRLSDVFEIPPVLIKSSIPHILVEIRGFWRNSKRLRRVTRITEILGEPLDQKIPRDEIQIRDIYSYDATKDQLVPQISSAETTVFSAANEARPLPKQTLDSWFHETISFLHRTTGKPSAETSKAFKQLRHIIMNPHKDP